MLYNLKDILALAKTGEQAIPAFNTPNLESIMAVIKAGEDNNFPVIISHAQLHESVTPMSIIAPIMIDLAKKSTVPVCVHLDHGEDVEYCKRAIDMGFTSVMFDGSQLSYEQNVENTIQVRKYAHAQNVSVEAELGRLKNRECGGEGQDNGEYTDAKTVVDFIAKTEVDALAICFGTAHGIYDKKPVLNFDIISQVVDVTDVPLVMHGGSGLTDEDYREVISRGVKKINYYTYMSYCGYDAVATHIQSNKRGFFHDLANVAIKAMYDNASERIRLYKGE